MSRGKKRFKDHAAKREAGKFVALPQVVLQSEEWAQLSAFAVKLMVDMLAQYRGDNNGDLVCYWSKMQRERRWRSKDTLFKALAELRNAGWLEVARQGGRNKTPTLYSLSIYAIDYCGGKLEVKPTNAPIGTWRRPKKIEPLARRPEPTPTTIMPVDTPTPMSSVANNVLVAYKRKKSLVREAYLSDLNRSASRTCADAVEPNRSASRTYSGTFGDVSGTPGVPLSRVSSLRSAMAESI